MVDTKEGTTFPFPFETLLLYLEKSTRTLVIKLNRPQQDHQFNELMLAELEKAFTWPLEHLEIWSILITSTTDHLGAGFDQHFLEQLDHEQLKLQMNRVQKLIFRLCQLPQTVIFDLQKFASGPTLELSLGGDIRIAHHNCQLQFNHLQQGYSPACGGTAYLGQLVSQSYARQWILSGQPILEKEMLSSGLIFQVYHNEEEQSLVQQKLLNDIFLQAPVARIQSKRAFLELIQKDLVQGLEVERSISQAALITNDWKEFIRGKNENRPPMFIDPRSLAILLKKLKNTSPGKTLQQ